MLTKYLNCKEIQSYNQEYFHECALYKRNFHEVYSNGIMHKVSFATLGSSGHIIKSITEVQINDYASC